MRRRIKESSPRRKSKVGGQGESRDFVGSARDKYSHHKWAVVMMTWAGLVGLTVWETKSSMCLRLGVLKGSLSERSAVSVMLLGLQCGVPNIFWRHVIVTFLLSKEC